MKQKEKYDDDVLYKEETALLKQYCAYLHEEEKSKATIEKYKRDIRNFYRYLEQQEITKQITIEYKKYLIQKYAPASVNSMLTALNQYLDYIGKGDCKVKMLRIQKQIFAREEKELTTEEYQRLLRYSQNTRLAYILQTICETGIRISELPYITVEAVYQGRAVVECKNKTRIILLSSRIRKVLKQYIKKYGIKTGSIFVSRTGQCLNRSNIWRDMKKLCEKAGVDSDKVFPHNLRHLFARTFYSIDKDIVRLADVLGHSNINTTRIYTIESGRNHMRSMECMHKYLMT